MVVFIFIHCPTVGIAVFYTNSHPPQLLQFPFSAFPGLIDLRILLFGLYYPVLPFQHLVRQ